MAGADETLEGQCAAVATAATDGAAWIERNRDQMRAEAEIALRDLRRIGYVGRRLEAAARRKMCVGVFGPSQAGKSYLISTLARPPGAEERLFAGGSEVVEVASHSQRNFFRVEKLPCKVRWAMLGTAPAFDARIRLQRDKLRQVLSRIQTEILITR